MYAPIILHYIKLNINDLKYIKEKFYKQQNTNTMKMQVASDLRCKKN